MATAQKTETGWDHAERHKPEPNPKFSGAAPVAPVAATVSPAVSAPAPAAAATPPVVPVAPVSAPSSTSAPITSVQTTAAPVASVQTTAAPAPKLTLAQRIKAALEKAEGATEAEIENILEGK